MAALQESDADDEDDSADDDEQESDEDEDEDEEQENEAVSEEAATNADETIGAKARFSYPLYHPTPACLIETVRTTDLSV